MSYQLSLIHADVPERLRGEVRIGLRHQGQDVASVDLEWTEDHFTGRFNGLASQMPEPGHPLSFVKAVVDEINGAKRSPDEPISSVFARTELAITI